MNLYQLIFLLPTEIVEIIRRLSYKPQNILLLDDIQNFYKTKELSSILGQDNQHMA